MRGTPGSGRGWRERGAAAVELAIVFPMLMLIIAGIVDFGRYFMVEIQLTNAVREGARVSVIGHTPADVTTRVLTAAPVAPGLTAAQVTVVPCPGDTEVTAEAPDFDWVILEPMMTAFGAAGALPTPTATAVMRCEAVSAP